MNNVTFEDFISLVNAYNKDEVEKVTKAYEVSKKMHEGQKRDSGEDYIIHPLNVAYILALMHADGDTLCAGLLHDTLEDTPITKEEIEKLFNSEVANLVDGVTKINNNMHIFKTKEDEESANQRKIITGITNDARIIIIKLADRLHNMRTLEYKTPFKQKENAIETMEIYVPFAGFLGGYRIKNELEDLSFKYLKPDKYNELSNYKKFTLELNRGLLLEMSHNIKSALNNKNIYNDIQIKDKNIYSIYKRMNNGQLIDNIHDMLALKIIVDNIDNCYLTLGQVHSLYNPYNSKFKDYICNPKPNMYQSLHTTLFSGEKLVQIQIRTPDMDMIAAYGLMAYWYTNKGNARDVMEKDLSNKFQFYQSLNQINSMYDDNKEFLTQVKSEVFSDRVYVYNSSGEVIELPKGANIIDFAFKSSPESARHMIAAFVNNEFVPFDYVLNNKERVSIITDRYTYNNIEEWEDKAQTSYAKKLIKKNNI